MTEKYEEIDVPVTSKKTFTWISCDQCGKETNKAAMGTLRDASEVVDKTGWFVLVEFDLLNRNQPRHFCSANCVSNWIEKIKQ